MHPVQQWLILTFVLQMQDHNEKECPGAELKCPFSVVGCPFEVQQALNFFPRKISRRQPNPCNNSKQIGKKTEDALLSN